METVTISLSKAHKEFVEAQMAEAGLRSLSKYIDTLLRAERRRKAEEKLLALVQEAEASGPATPMTKEDWAEIRREVAERLAQRKKKPRQATRQAK
jgi:hypothetical protein